jgi:hypothetical protein
MHEDGRDQLVAFLTIVYARIAHYLPVLARFVIVILVVNIYTLPPNLFRGIAGIDAEKLGLDTIAAR